MRAGLLRLPPLIPAVPDRDLLRRFADARDEGAFAELVRRHGPMVLAVCRRVVSDSHLADDAFQATFVVLEPVGVALVERATRRELEAGEVARNRHQ